MRTRVKRYDDLFFLFSDLFFISILDMIFITNWFFYMQILVNDCENGIPKLGHGDRFIDDCCWSTANTNCLFIASLPNTQSRSRYSSRINPKERDHRINKTNDGRWWCKYIARYLSIKIVNAFDSENHLVLIVKCSILKCVNKIDNKTHISFLVFNAC